MIYRFQAPLCFVNCKVFQSRLDLVCGIDRTQLEDADKPGCIQVLMTKVRHYITVWLEAIGIVSIVLLQRMETI